jgi:lysine 2,3-aminomutase
LLGKLGFPETKNSNERVVMKKDLLSTEDFEPPSPTAGLGGSKLAKNSECPLQVKTQKKNVKVISIQKISSVPRFRTGPRSLAFRKGFFPEVSLAEWNNWHWQLKHRIRDIESLSKLLVLSEDEKLALSRESHPLPVAITPYYASLLERENPAQPVRRTVVPVTDEYFTSPGEAEDPLAEEHDSPVPGLVHRYPDRVLFLVTNFCSTYCRYCTRSRIVGGGKGSPANAAQWEKAIAYIERTPAVRDVLLSGGDPLTLSDEVLEWLISRVRNIRRVELIRIGTKVPVVLPQRITPALVRMLKKYHPIWMSIHFTHPDELTPEANQACERLADGGIPLGSQTVLLSGVNDDVETMKRMVHGLLKIRVKPYYLYQCDPILGSSHFRTPVEKGLEIIRGLRGYTTGYAVPHYVIDAPGGGGKIPLLPEYFIGRSGDDLLLRNYEGKVFSYPEPARAEGTERPSEAIGQEAGVGP